MKTIKKTNLSLRYKKIAKIATKALNDKFKYKAQDGKIFLEDVPIGTVWEIRKLSGIKVNDSINPCVLVYDYRGNSEDRSYYLGKHSFAGKTEITVITMGEYDGTMAI